MSVSPYLKNGSIDLDLTRMAGADDLPENTSAMPIGEQSLFTCLVASNTPDDQNRNVS